MGSDDDELIAAIYEAGAMPERWVEVMEAISSRLAATGSNLIRWEAGGVRFLSTPSVAWTTREFADLGWNSANSRVERLIARAPHPGFLTDSDLHSREELESLPIYKDFLNPRGVAAGAATIVQGAGSDELIFTIEGFADHAASRAATPWLDRLRRHLGRALVLSSQLRLQQVRAAATALELIGVGAALIDHKNRLQATNRMFEAEVGSSLVNRSTRIHAVHKESDRALLEALNLLGIDGGGRSIVLRKADSWEPVVLHLIPVRGEARDVFTGTKAVAVLANTRAENGPGADLIQALFDVTPAEARVARAVARGDALADVAGTAGVSINTVRTQLRNVFEKSGVSRQSELAILLRRFTPPVSSV